MRIDSAAVVGLGAMGSAYLGKLVRVVPREYLQVIAPRDRAERYRRDGVTLCGRKLDLNIVEPHEARPADLVIFTVKFYDLRGAIEAARGAVGPNTVILSLLNGITSEDVIAEAFGREHVLLSLAIGIDAVRTGSNTDVSVYGTIPFGEEHNDPSSPTPRVKAICDFFDRAEIAWSVPRDMRAALWQKFMMNVGVNQTSAVLECPYGVLQRDGEARRICISAMEEVLSIAPRAGVSIDRSDMERGLAALSTLSPAGKCSMLQDVEARRRTEVDIFGGTVSRLGVEHGVPTPVNDMLVRIIKAKEEISC